MSVDQWTAEVITALRTDGIRPVLIKGPPVARWLYPDEPSLRAYLDVDVMVAPDDVDRAERMLADMGFVGEPVTESPASPRLHARTWQRPSDGAVVDLHRTFHGCAEVPNEQLWHRVTAATETMEVAGVEVEVPGPAMQALQVALHRFEDAGSQTDTDLVRAVAQVEMATWEEAARLARDLGLDGELGIALRASVPGNVLAGALGLPALGRDSLRLSRALSRQGGRGRLRYLARTMFPPPQAMRRRSALARSGAIGLGVAYTVRVVAGLTRAPRAALGWWRLQRRAGRDPKLGGR